MTFFQNECVRSLHRGLGLVVMTGADPVVQFLNGGRHKVKGRELRIVPRDVYVRAVQIMEANERWLDMRIHGEVQPRTPAVLPPEFDLFEALRQPQCPFDNMEDTRSEGVPFFVSAELSRDPSNGSTPGSGMADR